MKPLPTHEKHLTKCAAGTLAFAPPAQHKVSAGASGIVAADLNADGVPDLAVVSGDGDIDTVSVLMGHGDGTFAAKVDWPTGKDAYAIAAGTLRSGSAIDLVITIRLMSLPDAAPQCNQFIRLHWFHFVGW